MDSVTPADDESEWFKNELETTLCMDISFSIHSGLASRLIELLENKGLDDAPKKVLRDRWLRNLQTLRQSQGVQSWQKSVAEKSGTNPLVGLFTTYPVAACLLQEAAEVVAKQAEGLQLLFLISLLCSPAEEKSFRHIADVFRRALGSVGSKVSVLKQLPKYTSYSVFLTALHRFLGSSIANEVHRVNPELLGSIRKVITCLQPQKEIENSILRSTKNEEKMVNHHAITLKVTEGNFAFGELGSLPLDRTEGDEEGNGEAPQVQLYFTAKKPAKLGDGRLHDDEIDAGTRESRRWISRQQRLVPGITSRFTPLEKNQFITYIRKELADHNPQKQITGALITLMYVTGIDLDDLLKVTIGRNGQIGPGGCFIRRLKSPKTGYKPPVEILLGLVPSADEIILQLPEPICSWICGYANQSTQPLANCLGITPQQARDSVSDAMTTLRERGRYSRIRLDRIPAALAIEITLARQDPLTTFYLAGNVGHASPMLAYYIAPSVPLLGEVYAEVTRVMMES